MAKNCFKDCKVKLDTCVVGDGIANGKCENSKMNSNNGSGSMNSSDTTNYGWTRPSSNLAEYDHNPNARGKSKSKNQSKSAKKVQYQSAFVKKKGVSLMKSIEIPPQYRRTDKNGKPKWRILEPELMRILNDGYDDSDNKLHPMVDSLTIFPMPNNSGWKVEFYVDADDRIKFDKYVCRAYGYEIKTNFYRVEIEIDDGVIVKIEWGKMASYHSRQRSRSSSPPPLPERLSPRSPSNRVHSMVNNNNNKNNKHNKNGSRVSRKRRGHQRRRSSSSDDSVQRRGDDYHFNKYCKNGNYLLDDDDEFIFDDSEIESDDSHGRLDRDREMSISPTREPRKKRRRMNNYKRDRALSAMGRGGESSLRLFPSNDTERERMRSDNKFNNSNNNCNSRGNNRYERIGQDGRIHGNTGCRDSRKQNKVRASNTNNNKDRHNFKFDENVSPSPRSGSTRGRGRGRGGGPRYGQAHGHGQGEEKNGRKAKGKGRARSSIKEKEKEKRKGEETRRRRRRRRQRQESVENVENELDCKMDSMAIDRMHRNVLGNSSFNDNCNDYSNESEYSKHKNRKRTDSSSRARGGRRSARSHNDALYDSLDNSDNYGRAGMSGIGSNSNSNNDSKNENNGINLIGKLFENEYDNSTLSSFGSDNLSAQRQGRKEREEERDERLKHKDLFGDSLYTSDGNCSGYGERAPYFSSDNNNNNNNSDGYGKQRKNGRNGASCLSDSYHSSNNDSNNDSVNSNDKIKSKIKSKSKNKNKNDVLLDLLTLPDNGNKDNFGGLSDHSNFSDLSQMSMVSMVSNASSANSNYGFGKRGKMKRESISFVSDSEYNDIVPNLSGSGSGSEYADEAQNKIMNGLTSDMKKIQLNTIDELINDKGKNKEKEKEKDEANEEEDEDDDDVAPMKGRYSSSSSSNGNYNNRGRSDSHSQSNFENVV